MPINSELLTIGATDVEGCPLEEVFDALQTEPRPLTISMRPFDPKRPVAQQRAAARANGTMAKPKAALSAPAASAAAAWAMAFKKQRGGPKTSAFTFRDDREPGGQIGITFEEHEGRVRTSTILAGKQAEALGVPLNAEPLIIGATDVEGAGLDKIFAALQTEPRPLTVVFRLPDPEKVKPLLRPAPLPPPAPPAAATGGDEAQAAGAPATDEASYLSKVLGRVWGDSSTTFRDVVARAAGVAEDGKSEDEEGGVRGAGVNEKM